MNSKQVFIFSLMVMIVFSIHQVKAIYTDDNINNPTKISTSSFEVTFDNSTYQFSYIFEHSMDRLIKIKNLKNEPIELNMKATILINGREEEVSNWPQPFPYHFEAGEEKEIFLKEEWINGMDSNWEKGKVYDYPFNVMVFERYKPDTAVQFALQNQVLVLEKEQNANQLQTNAKISGVIYDEVNQKVQGAHVIVWSDWPRVSYETTTDSSGAFSVPVPAHKRTVSGSWVQYSIIVEKDGYETYNAAASPEEGKEATITGKMIKRTESADYRLVTKYDTGLPTERVDFSKDGNYFVTAPFHSSENISFIKDRAYMHLFSSDGKLVCRYKLDNEIPTVDISDDGKLIAIVHRPSIDNWMGGDYVLILDQNCSEVWRYDGIATQDGGGPSEVRISHDDKYLAVGTYDGRFFLLDIPNKKLLWNVTSYNGQTRFILFNEDDSGIFFGSDPNLFHYKINGEFDWKAAIGSWPHSMVLSKDYIFVGAKVGRFISLINKDNGNIIWRYPIDTRPDDLLISPDETYLVYQSSPGNQAIKNAFFNTSGDLLFNLQGANGGAISSDSQYIVYYNGNSVHLVNRRGNELWTQQLDPEKWPAPRGGISISEDKKHIIVADAVNGIVYFFEGGITNETVNPGANNQGMANPPLQNQNENVNSNETLTNGYAMWIILGFAALILISVSIFLKKHNH